MAALMSALEANPLPQEKTSIHSAISVDGSKQLLSIFPPFQPTGIEAVHLSKFFREELEPDARRIFEHAGRRYEFRAQHTSAISVQLEEERRLSAAAPWIFGLGGACTVASVGLLFRSAVVPLKLVLTVMLPILATYGATIAVFQFDVWSLPSAGLGSAHGAGYNTMYLSVGCLFGLAMDYDIFLFARVYEHRLAGHDNLSAVQRATAETGPVITTAGTLMAMSFFFIALSGVAIVRMIGFTYLVGACLDTWVVRPCIAPAFLCAFGEMNYWPGVVPDPPTKFEW